MNTPASDHAHLHELELDVRVELTQAETSQLETDGVPTAQSFDEEAQRYEVSLHALLCAIEAVEDESSQ